MFVKGNKYGNVLPRNGKFEAYVCTVNGNVETITFRRNYKVEKTARNYFVRNGFVEVPNP